MSVNLVKGQRVDLTKNNPGLTELKVGLGWDINSFGGSSFDLDAMAFIVTNERKVEKQSDFVYYNNLSDVNNSVVLSGDNRTGEGDGDDETIIVNLNKVSATAERILLCINIYEAQNRNQNFGMVNNAYVRILDNNSSKELVRYDLTEDFSANTAVVAAELYRHNGEWKFGAIGEDIENFNKLLEKVGL